MGNSAVAVAPVVPANAVLRANTRTYDVIVQEGGKTGRLSVSETIPVVPAGPILLSPKPTDPVLPKRFFVTVFEITHVAGKQLAEPMAGQLTEEFFADAMNVDEAVAIAKVFFFQMWAQLDTAFWTGKLEGVRFK